jgi:hypothetical protein
MRPNFDFNFDKPEKKRLYIIGGGPSVLQYDVNKLHDGDTMVVNRAIEYVDNPTYFLTMDYTYIRDKVKPCLLDKAKYKIFVLNTAGNITEHKGVYYDSRFGLVYHYMAVFNKVFDSKYVIAPETGFGLNEDNFAHGENSGFAALQTALILGYDEIVLIGLDLTVTNKTHFHGGYGQNPGVFMKKLNRYLMNYKSALGLLPVELKNKIVSGSRKSKLNQWIRYVNVKYLETKIPETKDFSLTGSADPGSPDIETLSKEEDYKIENDTASDTASDTANESANQPSKNLHDLIVVGYYTIDTPYEQEAKKTIASCEKFKLNYDISGVKNLGSWQANTRYKAQFMINMLKKHKDKRLLYIDCDAMFHHSPELFKNYSCDVAVRWQDFRWRQNECLSGTIYMENNERTMKLCKMWLATNTKQGSSAKSFEQWNLGTSIEKMRKTDNLIDKNLPPEYLI